jgi:hypothetical protein
VTVGLRDYHLPCFRSGKRVIAQADDNPESRHSGGGRRHGQITVEANSGRVGPLLSPLVTGLDAVQHLLRARLSCETVNRLNDGGRGKLLTEKQFVFLREAVLQLHHAVDAIETFKKLQSEGARPVWLFKALDDFSDHAARAATIFWPADAKYQERGRELRDLVSLNDDSPLKNKGLRNRLQHFDEKLEAWLKKPQTEAHLGDLCVDGKVKMNGKRIYGLREFDSQTMTFVFQGTEFPIAPVEAAARDLIAKIGALPAHPLGSLRLA